MRIYLRNNGEAGQQENSSGAFVPYMDFFPADGASLPLGAVLVLPGGGYHHRAAHEGDAVARRFNALGYHAFTLQYRVSPDIFPAPQQDVLRAIRIIRQNAPAWRIVPENIAVLGFSAGGHLAGCSGVLYDKIDCNENDEADSFSCRPDALILCYPVIGMNCDFCHKGSRDFLLGEADSAEIRELVDLHNQVTSDTPPAFLWHTAADAGVPVRNSIVFAEAMWKCGNTCELHVFPRGHHGLGLGMGYHDLAQWSLLAANFLEINCNFARGRF